MVVFDMASEEFTSLLKENQELKKQVEDIKQELTDERDENYKLSELWCDSRGKVRDLENQQKEFIKYLEDEIKSCELICNLIFNRNKEMKIYKEILQKYKEIIGGNNETDNN